MGTTAGRQPGDPVNKVTWENVYHQPEFRALFREFLLWSGWWRDNHNHLMANGALLKILEWMKEQGLEWEEFC